LQDYDCNISTPDKRTTNHPAAKPLSSIC